MLTIKYKSIATPFHHPFTTAHGLKTHQPALLIALTFNGVTGFGEAPAIHYYDVTVDGMIAQLISKIEVLQRYAYTEPDRFWHFCHHLFPDQHFLICALDMAYWDMYAKMNRKTIFELNELRWGQVPLTDYTIGIDTMDKMIEKVKEKPWPIYKIKMAGRQDLDIIKRLRQHTDAVFRVDANASWTLEDALTMIPELAKYNVELVEQPLAKDDWEGMKKLKEISILPLFADESCVTEKDVMKCCEVFDGININAIAQFLPLLDYVDMDGPLLLDVPPLKLLGYHEGNVSIMG
jgi:L-alanine-DL-glutamate epimerase-like enolase superfamily enzyme